ncbi:MAG TPA: endonuclease/exonuclease/phosphatase family protein [Solirubrobacteraceae bacterium]|jgi:hypothetical protein|nr:endonuclease/exonuclease/phosphatase family protein [Solirubrobacteraceae bacterium]
MTRILFWNINNFSTNGFFPADNAKPRSMGDDGEYGVPAAPADAKDRLDVLLGVIRDVAPDIVSIVEVKPGALGIAPGSLVQDTAAYKLLWKLRGLAIAGGVGAGQYCLVPPLVSGLAHSAEAVAVYYRKDRLQFLGPYGWSGAQAQPIGGGLGEYPEPWGPGPHRALPHRQIPVGGPNWPNAGLNEHQLAGQFTFTAAGAAAPLRFPGPGSRTPWLTYFRDIAGNRLLKLLSFHAPSVAGLAMTGTSRIAQIPEMTNPNPIAANEVRCIVGDFNVSSYDAARRPVAFGPLAAANYTMRFDGLGFGPGLPGGGYYVTVLKLGQQSTPWIRNGAAVYGYPAFGYMGTGAIDNALTHHGAGAGAAQNMTVCNPVVKTPYTLDPNRPLNVLEGTYQVNPHLSEPGLFAYNPLAGQMGIDGAGLGPGAVNAMMKFREWPNYTHIRSASDHLPIALDV